jgi:MFS family permease
METNKNESNGISKNVFVMGLVSFFNDIASEMVYPIVPIFLTAVLGAPASAVGFIEGIAGATASLLQVVSGRMSDKMRKRKIFVIFGYSFSTVSKVILGFANVWSVVLFGRFVDRFGKGVRTSARDALITESSTESNRGKSFGYHRAMDTAGAVVGPLLAIFLLQYFNDNLRMIFLIAFIPGIIGVILFAAFVKETPKTSFKKETQKIAWKNLDPSFKIFLVISTIFAIGNSSDAFLILRAQNLGLSVAMTVFAYVFFNFTYAIFSTPAGIISDRIGPRKMLFSGFVLFGLVYLSFGLANTSGVLWILFPIYGCYMALTEGVGKAYIANMVSHENSGTVFGIYQTVIGLCAFLSSLIAGLLWDHIGVSVPFIFGGITAFIAAFLFLFLEKRSRCLRTTAK